MVFSSKFTIGTLTALVLGGLMVKYMDDEHEYHKGVVVGSYKERKTRFSEEGSVNNWFPSHYFMNKDGIAIFWRSWLPTPIAQPSVKAIVVISHGLGEHSGRYEKLGTMLAAKGYAVYALDHQGHGQSEGTRHYVKWFSDFSADVHRLAELAKKKHPTVQKVFLLGHSMGALIAIHAVHEAPSLFNGVVLSAPPLKVDLPPFADKLIPVISSLLPKLPGTPLDLETLCHDKSVVDRYHNDPLNNMGPNTMRLLHQIIEGLNKVPSFSAKFPIPYILMHGTADKMCLPEGSKVFHESTKVEDKTLVIYDDAFHELYNEPESEKNAIAETIQWLEARN